jgi:TRAP-type mannitol/chloroaromatic compound transport system permease small subunit
MNALLRFSDGVDALANWFGSIVRWLVLGAVLISAGNAIIRKAFSVSSNAWLEIQWYLFSGVFMLGVGYVFLKNAHVRIDFISSRLSKRTNAWIDVLGIVIFIFPLCYLMIRLSWPLFANAWTINETSQNAGGLIRWPVYLLMPLGFAILAAQSVSELIKRVAFLRGLRSEPYSEVSVESDEEKLARELAEEAERHAIAAKVKGAQA